MRAVRQMTDALAHRGPDGEGIDVRPLEGDARVVLGHRRLAVIDPSPAGAQPMLDPATGNVITFNGEIYNFRAVRALLEGRGVRFRSATDTEVVLAAYRVWGDDCLDRLRGIYAFAVYDAARRQIVLARDRLGVKPLYYWQDRGELLFASEVRALLASGLVARRLDETGVASFLALGAVQEPRTVIEGVRMLPPGHLARWRAERLETRRSWRPEPPELPRSTDGTLWGELREKLSTAVGRQLVSDVPIGAFLSGGLDSSAVVALMCGAEASPRTVSVVFPEAAYSEAPYAREAARTFGSVHQEVSVDAGEARSLLHGALTAMDQPTIDGVNTYIVAKAARAAGLTVALSGLGGDELFGGYPSFRQVPWLERALAVPPALRRRAVALARPWTGRRDATRKLAALLDDGAAPHAAYLTVRELFTAPERARLLPGRAADGGGSAEVGDVRHVPHVPDAADDFARISWLELRHYTLNMLLRDTDVMSMAHGLEVRVPLLDEDVVTFVAGLTARAKTSGRGAKPLLAAALGDALPKAIVTRPKRGFLLPFAEWLRGPLGDEVADVLGADSEVVSRHGHHAVWNAFVRGETSWHRPWALYVLAEWVRNNVSAPALPVEAVTDATRQVATR